MVDVYITKATKFFPNDPVSNDEMEDFLGKIDDTASKTRRIVLRNNQIKNRFYALDRNGKPTHTNAEMVFQAIQQLYDADFSESDIEVLSCGSTTPDILLPSLAAMVHGYFEDKNVEINSASGACVSGMNALKYGYLSLKAGNSTNAVCTGSERTSAWMLADKFQGEIDSNKALEENPILAFNKDFLRWMLSDGAAAFLLETAPRGPLSLKIEWMDNYSYAHELETCMYAGGDKMEDGSIKSWNFYEPSEWIENSIFALKQDTRLLGENILVKGAASCKISLDKRNVSCDEIDFFLPHVSSNFFVPTLMEEMIKQEINIPFEKWFMNLSQVGNVGAASIFLMVEELLHSGKLKKGNKILLCVPESSRFSYAHALLTVV